jgi:GT2 family glycosyltransferase
MMPPHRAALDDAHRPPPRVHVVIVNWNCQPFLLRCLDALADQTCQDFHVTVVDNGSAAFDEEMVAARYRFVTCRRLSANEGFARANNRAIAESRGVEWTWLLNPDAFPAADCLARLLAAAAAHPDVACFGSRLIQASHRSRLDGAGDVYHVSGLVWRRGHGQAAARRYLGVEEVFSACGAAALYRTDALCDVQGFDEDFGSYVEDVDLGFRLRLAGHRCLYVPDAIVYHEGAATTGRRSDTGLYYGHRNVVWCFVKNTPAPLFWACLPCHVLMNLVCLAYYALHGRGAVLWRAKRDAWRGLGVMWRKRRQVQAARRASAVAVWRVMTIQPRRRPAEIDSTEIETGRIDTGQIATGRIDTGQMDTSQIDSAGASVRWSKSVTRFVRARFLHGRTPRGFGDVL